MRTTVILTGLIGLAAAVAPGAEAQDRPAGWQRSGGPTESPVTVFHSPHSVNLPTAETLFQGEWQFEVSHRFQPPVSAGSEALWGLDGPVFNRLGLAYAATDRLLIGILRTNLDDNVELNAKVRVAEKAGEVPLMLAVMGGVAWNTDPDLTEGVEDNESQLYGQAVLNALVGGRLALGVVPTVVRNADLNTVDPETSFALGLTGQVYVSEQVSFLTEWVVTESHTDLEHDTGSFGIELETGGHFFKLLLSNSPRMNPSQVLGGSRFAFASDEWRLGFNITRLLVF